MDRSDLQAASAVLVSACTGLNALPTDAASAAAASLRRATGAVAAEAESLIQSATFSTRLLACFQSAFQAGATFAGFQRLRDQIAQQDVTTPVARIVRRDAMQRALIQMARCSAATTFRDTDAVAAMQAQFNAIFAAVQDDTLDATDTGAYRALVNLHAAVTRDLTTRGRQLPRVVSYATGSAVPALVLAQQLYGDATRADELIAGNGAFAPLFMPLRGKALSA